jgi:hypothetical protein
MIMQQLLANASQPDGSASASRGLKLSPMRLPTVLLTTATLIMGGLGFAQDQNFEKDRKAILAMAGEFKVGFHFHETFSLTSGYKVEEKPYDEEALETVKVVEDSGRRIILQHLLLAGPAVVKHWASIWTYEDTDILQFEGSRTWTHVKITPEQAKGTWTERVTSVDDSPRYEGYGKWEHHQESSEWTSPSNRPLPRREYTTRKDYDLLVVTNRLTVTPEGWFHEQDNTKWVKRDGQEYPICRENGLNTYLHVTGKDFSKANDYWTKTEAMWKDVRQVWEELYGTAPTIKVSLKADGGSMDDVFTDLVEKAEDGKAPGVDGIRAILKPFVADASKAQP